MRTLSILVLIGGSLTLAVCLIFVEQFVVPWETLVLFLLALCAFTMLSGSKEDEERNRDPSADNLFRAVR